jgi:hypothetical protein
MFVDPCWERTPGGPRPTPRALRGWCGPQMFRAMHPELETNAAEVALLAA